MPSTSKSTPFIAGSTAKTQANVKMEVDSDNADIEDTSVLRDLKQILRDLPRVWTDNTDQLPKFPRDDWSNDLAR